MTESLVFDRPGALERVGGDLDLLRELAELCSEDFQLKLPVLQDAVASNDAPQVKEVAHSIKSAFGNLGAVRAFEAARDLEKAGREGDVGALKPGLERLVRECRGFLEFFGKEFGLYSGESK